MSKRWFGFQDARLAGVLAACVLAAVVAPAAAQRVVLCEEFTSTT